MCERICPNCNSPDHSEQYGITGLTIYCQNCFSILAHRQEPETAPLSLTEDEAEAWVRERSFGYE